MTQAPGLGLQATSRWVTLPPESVSTAPGFACACVTRFWYPCVSQTHHVEATRRSFFTTCSLSRSGQGKPDGLAQGPGALDGKRNFGGPLRKTTKIDTARVRRTLLVCLLRSAGSKAIHSVNPFGHIVTNRNDHTCGRTGPMFRTALFFSGIWMQTAPRKTAWGQGWRPTEPCFCRDTHDPWMGDLTHNDVTGESRSLHTNQTLSAPATRLTPFALRAKNLGLDGLSCPWIKTEVERRSTEGPHTGSTWGSGAVLRMNSLI